MKSHALAKLLLGLEDCDVIIPSLHNSLSGDQIQNIYLLQNEYAPFDYTIFLEGENEVGKNGIIEVDD